MLKKSNAIPYTIIDKISIQMPDPGSPKPNSPNRNTQANTTDEHDTFDSEVFQEERNGQDKQCFGHL